jgi:hypothetical protein
LARKLFARNTFEDHTKEFILRSQKRFELLQKQKRSNSLLPNSLNHVPNRFSSVISPSELGHKNMAMDDGIMEFEGDAEGSLAFQGHNRFRRQTADIPPASMLPESISSSTPSIFDRVMESLSKESQQLAERYQDLKRMTENLAQGLRNLQEKANISTDSLRNSAATLGSDLRSGLNNLVESVNSTMSGPTLEDLQNGLRSIVSRSTSDNTVSPSNSSDEMSVESVVSSLLTPNEKDMSSTTPSPLDQVRQQFNQFIQGAETFLRTHRSGKNEDQNPDERLSILTRLSNFARRNTSESMDHALPAFSTPAPLTL